MTIDKNRAMILVAAITAIAGLLTALVNRFDPNEPTAIRGYEATSKVVSELDEDVQDLHDRVKFLEQMMMKAETTTAHRHPRPKPAHHKKTNKRKRRSLPTIDVLQNQSSSP